MDDLAAQLERRAERGVTRGALTVLRNAKVRIDDKSLLEPAIESGPDERAQSHEPGGRGFGTARWRARSRYGRVPLIAAVLAMAVIVALGFVLLRPGTDHPDRVLTTPPPLTGFGAEFPLVSSPPAEAEISQMVRDAGGTVRDARASAVRLPDGTLINKWIARVGDSTRRCVSGGNTRSCGEVLSPQPPGAPKNVVELGDDETTHLLWLDFPSGTAYTTFTVGGTSEWQRPVNEMSVFSLPAVNGTPVHIAALDADRRELVAFDYTSTNGVWISDWPPWWNLDATLRWCASAPLIDVQRRMTGGQSERYRAFFPGVGIIDIGVRDACRQMAPLLPKPNGDLTVEWTMRDGQIGANYFDRSDGSAVPTPEATQRIADDRTSTKRFCTTRLQSKPVRLGCERGG